MIQVVFRNLRPSDLAKEAAIERLSAVAERFPGLWESHVIVRLSMENSPVKAGPDWFTVRIHCRGGKYRDVILEKSATNLYAALADVVEHLLERLNRFGDRKRIKSRRIARRLREQMLKPAS